MPLSMTLAQSYLAEDVFHRLDRGRKRWKRTKPTAPNRSSPFYSDCRLGSVVQAVQHRGLQIYFVLCDGSVFAMAAQDSGLPLPRADASAAGTPCNATTAFLGFLERQNHCEDLRRQRLEQIAAKMESRTGPAQAVQAVQAAPAAQAKTKNDSRAGEKEEPKPPKPSGPFEDRGGREKAALKAAVEAAEVEAAVSSKPKAWTWSFRPKILEISRRRQLRGSRELSLGDWQRRKLRLEELREDLLQTQDSYFKPKLNASHISGTYTQLNP